ncbi:hypothetical protein KEM52_006011 [Ascosphaera acerosa]|nr:hypothetical protein KEM52_006011 [Ascosphaera acerosa]
MKRFGGLRGNGDSSRTKAIIHACQGVIIFIAWAMTIAVFTREGSTDGRTAYYFALCWVTYPALIYLACFPLWPRTMRFANPYAFVTLDMLFGLLWFVAWVCIATYVGTGKSEGSGKHKDKSGCDAFAYGSPGKCKLSTGTIVLGVIVFLLFLVTSYFSVRTMVEYRRTGNVPFNSQYDPAFAAQSSEAFNSNLNPAHEFDEADDSRAHSYGDSTLDSTQMMSHHGGGGGAGGYSSLEGHGHDHGHMDDNSYVVNPTEPLADSSIHQPVPYDPSIYSRPTPRPPSRGQSASIGPGPGPVPMHLPPVDTSFASPFDDDHRYNESFGYDSRR